VAVMKRAALKIIKCHRQRAAVTK